MQQDLEKAGSKMKGALPVIMNDPDDPVRIQRYFKQLRTRLIIGLMACFLLPFAVLSAYFHFQFTSALKKTGKLSLAALSESQRNTIDLFLQERVVNLFSLYHSIEFNLNPAQHDVDRYLHNLRQVSDAFVDVGFLDSEGIQLGYSGPHTHLLLKDYSGEYWFQTLMATGKNYFISDIYLGFRQKPHLTIAVRQRIDGNCYIIRATLDPDKFYIFLRSISHGKEVESVMINAKGFYQVVDPARGSLLDKSDYIPDHNERNGVEAIQTDKDSVLIAYTWLREAQWALLVRQPMSIAHAEMYRARKVLAVSLLIILITLGVVLIVATTWLLRYAQAQTEKGRDLRNQLLHAAKLASVGELATGIAHEINNPLAIITSTSGVIRDMLNPEFDLDDSPDNILKELDTIDSAAFRARDITRQLLGFGRKNVQKPVLCDVNDILDEVIMGLKAREFKLAGIQLYQEYDPDLPEIFLDPDQIRQVFLNLLNNAGDAIPGDGIITVSTESDSEFVRVTVEDTGAGMTSDQLKHVFSPFYTTKEVGKGTGLGLSVSLGIVEAMGGKIEAQSLRGTGSSFTVSLPVNRSKGAHDEREYDHN